jgi:hypothetical protein
LSSAWNRFDRTCSGDISVVGLPAAKKRLIFLILLPVAFLIGGLDRGSFFSRIGKKIRAWSRRGFFVVLWAFLRVVLENVDVL